MKGNIVGGWIGEGGGIVVVVVVELLSETYTQLHTIDGLADPQTYKCFLFESIQIWFMKLPFISIVHAAAAV